jgi:alginate production protein
MQLSRGIYLEREIETADPETRARLRQAYVAMAGLSPGLSAQLGRQRFKDKREWWYDEDLDAARLFYRTGRFGLELSASRNEVVGSDFLNRERADRSTNYMAVGRYAYRDDIELSAYLIAQNRSETQEKPIFLGVRSIGRISPRFEHWIDAAVVRGTDNGRDIRAYGWDVGVEYRLDGSLQPSLLVGVAFGSGDANPNEGRNTEFRQTGLQGSYFYYGEVLAPELSNMWIYTAGVKLRPANQTSVRILYHLYRQHRLEARMRDVLVERDPDGRHRGLGQALDVVTSYNGIRNVYLDFIVGAFFPGPAFAPRDRAYFAQFLATYEFW